MADTGEKNYLAKESTLQTISDKLQTVATKDSVSQVPDSVLSEVTFSAFENTKTGNYSYDSATVEITGTGILSIATAGVGTSNWHNYYVLYDKNGDTIINTDGDSPVSIPIPADRVTIPFVDYIKIYAYKGCNFSAHFN